jgi:hypothetical protein
MDKNGGYNRNGVLFYDSLVMRRSSMIDQKRILLFMVWCLFLVGACQLTGQAVEGNQPEPGIQEQEDGPDEDEEGDSTAPSSWDELLAGNWRHTGRKTELEMLIEEGKVVLEGIVVSSPDEDFTGEIMTISLTNPTDAPIEVVIQPGQVLLPVMTETSMGAGGSVLAALPPLSKDQQGDWNPSPDFPRMDNAEFLEWWGEMPEDYEPTDEQWEEWTHEWEIRYGIDPDNIPHPWDLAIPPVPLVQDMMIVTTSVWKTRSMTSCKQCSSAPMITTQNEPILIQPGETVEIVPYVACIDAGVDAPPQGHE